MGVKTGEFYAKNNPFQRSGPVGATERIAMAKNDKVIYVRVDMPGVPKECLYLTTFPDNVVFCGGLAPVVCEGDRGRLYGASYGLRSHKLRKPQVNISNGVATVKMKVSKVIIIFKLNKEICVLGSPFFFFFFFYISLVINIVVSFLTAEIEDWNSLL